MKVVLAEKPSVARDIAAVLGATAKRDGYFEGNGYAVTYAFGHLVTIDEPESMNSAWGKPWRLAQLPMIPESWQYRITDKGKDQFNVIKRLFTAGDTSSIICATDAGREGEHIFRLIYMLSGSRKPVERLWISSLTEEAISKGLAKLVDAKEFDNLADAASARAHADWLVGLNFTRLYTTLNRELCTVGRVQTPTLNLIVAKQAEIDNFKITPFFEVFATFEPGFVARYITPGAEPQTRLSDKAAAQAIVSSVAAEKKGKVLSVITSEKRTKAPALFDLLTLQKVANKRFGYTAQETLNIAQSLYEEYKLISYPRTESRHLSNDMVGELPRVLSTLLRAPQTTQSVRDLFASESIVPGSITASQLKGKLGKSYVDDAKLTDHHAIIPTHNLMTAGLPEKQRNLYMLVVMSFLSIFLPAEVRDETTVLIKLREHDFRAKGVVIKEPGWTALEPKKKDEDDKDESKPATTKGAKKSAGKDDDDNQQLPALSKGDEPVKKKVELKERKTSVPKPYDDASLLTAMKNAGQELDDEDLAAYMKQRGLGTPATRAAIIERLLQTGYIERNKKWLTPTEKGKALIAHIHDDLKDIALTANWEQRLADMQDGKLSLATFEADIAGFIERILPPLKSGGAALPVTVSAVSGGIAPCPLCKRGVVRETPSGAGCTQWREGCKFTVWREQRGKKLTDAQIHELVKSGATKVIKGFKSKDGKTKYDGRLLLTQDGKVIVEGMGGPASTASLGDCPQCTKGTVRFTPRGAGCSRWQEGCTLSIWREQYGKELTDEQIKELVTTKSTGLIEGFQKKSGNGTYNARLALNSEFKVRPVFDDAVSTASGAESPSKEK